jgi:hypothetical protein
VYPEIEKSLPQYPHRGPRVVFRNRDGARFDDVTAGSGPGASQPRSSRGAAFGDYDNDGDVDVVVNNVHDAPDLFRLETDPAGQWVAVKLVGTRSNRSAIGARVRCTAGGATQTGEVRGGGSYISQNDLRVHFGLGPAGKVDRLEVRWPSGGEEEWLDLPARKIHTLTEGSGRPLGNKG